MTYRFGVFEFREGELRLTRQGSDVRLEPQPAKALAVLVARAGEVVSRDDLRAAIWPPGTHVDFERGVAYCMNQLRTALGDRADNPRFIETLPRRGFRFIAPVTTEAPAGAAGGVNTPAAVGNGVGTVPLERPSRARVVGLVAVGLAAVIAAGWWYASRPAAGPVAGSLVAVSVFDNETGDTTFDPVVSLIGDSVVERLVSSPARVAVVGNMPSVRAPRGQRDLGRIRDETRAAFVVLGQLQRREGRLSLFLQLIRFRDGAHVWVDRIERPDGDTLAGVEAEAAQRVETAVTSALAPARNGS